MIVDAMARVARSRAWLVAAYGVALVVAALVSLAVAHLAHSWQHRHWEARYFLLPVNHFRFHFIPLAAVGCSIAAKVARRSNLWIVLASGILVGAAIASALFWYGVGVELGETTDRGRVDEAVRARLWMSLTLGAVILFGIVSLLLGVAQTLSFPRVAKESGTG
jgi:hypothetical protein